MGEEPDGQFAHPPEPTAENLAGVLTAVTDAGAEVGFCQDPDADRLAVIDQSGRYLGEEYTLAMCVDHVLRQRKGPIAANCASSRMSEDLASATACRISARPWARRTWSTPCLPTRPFSAARATAARSTRAWATSATVSSAWPCCWTRWPPAQMRIGQLADELPRYEIVKTKISLPPEKLPAALDALEKRFSDAAADRLDGLRLDWPGRWLLVRGSNTEPIVRGDCRGPDGGGGVESLCGKVTAERESWLRPGNCVFPLCPPAQKGGRLCNRQRPDALSADKHHNGLFPAKSLNAF